MRSGTGIAMTVLWALATASVAMAQDDPVVETFVGVVVRMDDSIENGTIEKLASGAVRVTRWSDKIQVTILADQIKGVRKLQTALDDFADRHKALDQTQAKNFWELADWCKDRQKDARDAQFHEQLKAKEIEVLEEMVKLFTDSQDATNKYFAMLAGPRLTLLRGETGPVIVTPAETRPAGELPEPEPLGLDEIQEIRWKEWKPSDRARPTIPQKLLEKYGLRETPVPDRFAALRDQQLPDEERKQIRFHSDVDALLAFKIRANRILVRDCATPNCHGGPHAKAWRMVNKAAPSTGELYANFKLLQPYINRDSADRSKLLRAGLKYDPADRTETAGLKAHPPSMAAQPIWQDTSAADYKTLLAWIRDLRFQQGSGMPFPGWPGPLPPPGDEPGPRPPGGGPLDPPPLP